MSITSELIAANSNLIKINRQQLIAKFRSNSSPRIVGECETVRPKGQVCTKCNKLKPWYEYHSKSSKKHPHKLYYSSTCKPCRALQDKKRREK